jgi:hypothetical protein
VTLAYTNKPLRRKGLLLMLALFAVIGATIGGLAVVRTAFAHHNSYTAEVECDLSWSALGRYDGGTGERIIGVNNVQVNGVAYDSSWSSALTSNGFRLLGGAPTFESASDGPPSGTTVYFKGTFNGVLDIFNRSGLAGTFLDDVTKWGGKLYLYSDDNDGDNKWDKVDTDNVEKPKLPRECKPKIHIHKYVPKDNPSDGWKHVGPKDWDFNIDGTGSNDYTAKNNEAKEVTVDTYTITELAEAGYTLLDIYVPDHSGN